MMSKVFGRANSSEEVVEKLEELSSQVEEQGAGLVSVNTNVVEMHKVLEGFRQYIEGMEVRLHTRSEAAFNDMQKAFEQGIETTINVVKKEISQLGEIAKPQEVVKEIERQTASEKKVRALDTNMSKLQGVVAEYLVNELPLISDVKGYKYPQLTPQGDAVYKEVTRFITQLAKIAGRNKEYYTNSDVYQMFFDRFGISRYGRATVRTSKGRQMTTLLATIIVNGHIKQYINFIKTLSNKEKELTKQ